MFSESIDAKSLKLALLHRLGIRKLMRISRTFGVILSAILTENKSFYLLSTYRLQGKYRNIHALGNNRKHVLHVSKIQYHNVESSTFRFKSITWDSKLNCLIVIAVVMLG